MLQGNLKTPERTLKLKTLSYKSSKQNPQFSFLPENTAEMQPLKSKSSPHF